MPWLILYVFFSDPPSIPTFIATDVGNERRYECFLEEPGTPAVQLQIKV